MWYATLSEHNTCAGRPHAPHTWRFLATDGVSLLAYRWRHRPPVAEALGASASDTATRLRYGRGQGAPGVRRPQVRGILGTPPEAYRLITPSRPRAL
jgi:hypothetical protein